MGTNKEAASKIADELIHEMVSRLETVRDRARGAVAILSPFMDLMHAFTAHEYTEIESEEIENGIEVVCIYKMIESGNFVAFKTEILPDQRTQPSLVFWGMGDSLDRIEYKQLGTFPLRTSSATSSKEVVGIGAVDLSDFMPALQDVGGAVMNDIVTARLKAGLPLS